MYLLFYQEVDLGLAADVGTLQRLPKITGNESFVKDICYTARKVFSQEALQMGMVRYGMAINHMPSYRFSVFRRAYEMLYHFMRTNNNSKTPDRS